MVIVNFKVATSRFVRLEKFCLNFSSSSFAIRVNLHDPSLFIITSLVFFYLPMCMFCGFLQFDYRFAWRKNRSEMT